jgi:tRNA-splicing endonuclease subunit Sen15
VAHNLRFQHAWTDVRIHYTLLDSLGRTVPLPRPLLSGLPPRRLYVHPDEQVEILRQRKSGEEKEELVRSEREWVLPSQLREKWSLRRFGEVFDCLPAVPGVGDGEVLFDGADAGAGGEGDGDVEGGEVNEWRTKIPKRLLLATLDDDSTVVYYIVHDGIVKPRQN